MRKWYWRLHRKWTFERSTVCAILPTGFGPADAPKVLLFQIRRRSSAQGDSQMTGSPHAPFRRKPAYSLQASDGFGPLENRFELSLRRLRQELNDCCFALAWLKKDRLAHAHCPESDRP